MFTALAISLTALASAPVSANPFDDLVYAKMHFEIPGTDLIPGVAAVRASCDIDASGEPLVVLANATARSTLAATAGPCAITVILFGRDVALPVFDSTPLGRSAFYVPGISTVSFGIVDLSVDLVTSLKSTSRIANGIAAVTPADAAWPSWGAHRIWVHGQDGVGSIAASELNTTFAYTMSLALTVYAVSFELYHVDLKQIGSFAGRPSLVSDLSVDLRPHALALAAPDALTSDRATFAWTGSVDSDVDHLELRLADGTTEVAYHVPPAAAHVDVLLRPSTHYEARIVSIDRNGQATSSNMVAFESPASTPPPAATLEVQGSAVLTWTLVTLAVLVGIVGYATGFLRGRRGD